MGAVGRDGKRQERAPRIGTAMAADLAAAVTDADGGVLLAVEVRAGAAEDRFPDGFDPWRRRVRVRVRAPAVEGRANEAVCRAVAAHFGLALAAVVLVHGPTSRHKTLLLRGVARDAAVAALEEAST